MKNFLTLLLLTILVIGCAKEDSESEKEETSSAPSTNYMIYPSSVKLAKNGTLNLLVYIEESGTEAKVNPSTDNISWSSSDTSVLDVDKYGSIKGKGDGTVTVTMNATISGTNYSDSIEVSVKDYNIREINLNPYLIMMAKEESRLVDLYATDSQGNPTNLTPSDITYSVSDESVFTVSKQTNGQPKIESGSQKGHAFLTVSYLGFSGQPVKVYVADSVEVEPNSSDDHGKYSSLFVAPDNKIHVSYYNNSKGTLKYAVWDETVWNAETVEMSHTNSGQNSRIIVANTIPYIAYQSSNQIKIKGKNNGVWSYAPTLESSGTSGPRMAFGLFNNKPIIFYPHNSGSNTELKVALYDNNTWNKYTVSSSYYSNTGIDMKFSGNKVGVVFIDSNSKVNFLESNFTSSPSTWSAYSGLSTLIDNSSNQTGSTVLNYSLDGKPHVTYLVSGGGAQFAKETSTAFGSSWGQAVLDGDTQFSSPYLGAMIDWAGRDRITYHDAANFSLKLVKYNSIKQSFDQPFTADSGGKDNHRVGEYASIGVNLYGQTIISYYNATTKKLQYYIEPYNPN